MKDDWILSIYEDLSQLKIEKSLDDIKIMKKEEFKQLIKKKVNDAALQYLNDIKSTHSKMETLSYKVII